MSCSSASALEVANIFLGKAFFLFSHFILFSGLELKGFLLVSSRWRYSTNFWFLLPELPLVIFESWHFPPSTTSLRGVAWCPCCPCLCLWGHWYLSAASVSGIPAWGTGMASPSATSEVSCVASSAAVGGGWRGGRSQGSRCLCHVWDCWICGCHCCGQEGW